MTGSQSENRRVLLVAPQPFYSDRGTPICVRQLVEALLEIGHEIDLLTYPIGVDISHPGLRIFRSGNPFGLERVPIGFSWRKVLLDASLAPRLHRMLSSRYYRCVHALEEAAFPAVYHGRRAGVVTIYDMHSSMAEQIGARPLFRPLRGVANRLERWLVRNADFVVCSAGLATKVRAIDPKARVREWQFAPVSAEVAPDRVLRLRQDLDLAPHHRVVLYSGTFESYQGIELLIDAARIVLHENSSAMLLLVGLTPGDNGDIRTRVADNLPADRVRLISRQPREELAAYHQLADVAVSSRVFGGNLPLKIFDYLAAGRPIVATDIPAHRAVLDDDRAVLAAAEPSTLARAMLDLLGDPVRADRLGQAAREYARARFGWGTFVRDVDELYREAGVVPAGADAKHR